MLGLMQDRPLTLAYVFHRAEQLFGHKTLVTATADGEISTTLGEWARRVRRLATVLDTLGITADGRVGTFCWNTARHLELYCAAPCTGRVLHTLNIRLFPEQLVYIANHAEDEVVFVDRSLLPLLEPLADKLESVRHFVVIDDGADVAVPDGVARLRDPAGRGRAVHRHVRRRGREHGRRDVLHVRHHGQPEGRRLLAPLDGAALAHLADRGRGCALGARRRAAGGPDVPRQRVGAALRRLLAGASQVYPGPNMTPQAIVELLERHRVTVTGGVPTIWMGMLPSVDGHDLSALRQILCGGSAVPRSLSEAYKDALGLPDPAGLGHDRDQPDRARCPVPRSHWADLDEDGRIDTRARQGQAVPLVDLRIVDPDTGEAQPWDDDRHRRGAGRGPVDREGVLPRRRRRHAVHRGRLAAHRRRRGGRPVRLASGSSTAPRT